MSGEKIIIQDVGPRDGLQNQPRELAPEQRLEIIRALVAAGVSYIQVGAFVSPKAVPAMAGAGQILQGLAGEQGEFSVLIPNQKGYELAQAAGAKIVEMVLYGSDGMAQANVNMSREQAEAQAFNILARAREDGIRVLSTISVAYECPFDGPVDPGLIREITARFLDQGSDVVVIADTIGAADPAMVSSLMRSLVDRHGADRLSCHFHDTRAMGLANVYAAIEAGIRRFDASIAGVGGCPFAPGASGNVATEDVVMMAEQLGHDTGIDMSALLKAAELVKKLTGNAPGGRAAPWLERKLAKTAQAELSGA